MKRGVWPAFWMMVAWVLLGASPRTARADEFCVNSAAQLSAAINGAVPNGASRVIKVVQGNYSLAGQDVAMDSNTGTGEVWLLGGYSAGCASRSVDAANTVLDGAGGALVLQSGGPATLSGLTLTGFSQGMQVLGIGTFATTIRLRDLILRNNNATEPLYVFAPGYADATVRMSNVLAHGNSAGACVVRTQASHLRAMHLTAADNAAPAALCSQSADAQVKNSLFWNNGAFDINIQSGALQLRFSTFQNVNGTLEPGSGNNDASNPQFVNAGTGNYRLSAGSPAVNAGLANFEGGLAALDLEGNLRLRGVAPDRGAYESAVSGLASHIVTNTSDGEPAPAGSLRAAIEAANANANASVLSFSIAGGCPKVITLAAPLPDITAPLRVEGWSQPGAAPNSLDVGSDARHCLVLAGSGASGNRNHGLRASGATLEVRGVDFSNFSTAGVRADGGSGHRVQGIQVGGMAGDVALAESSRGVLLDNNATLGLVGGAEPGMRNVLGGTTFYGVALSSGANAVVVEGNYLGVDAQGQLPLPNLTGVSIFDSPFNTVRGNVIAGNGNSGVAIANAGSIGNTVTRNRVGYNAEFAGYINGGPAIAVSNGASSNVVGALADNDFNGGNLILPLDGAPGVLVTGNASVNNRVELNLFGNQKGVGIELGSAGREPNDGGDADSGPNNLQNFPWLTGTDRDGALTTLRGVFTHAAGSFSLKVYYTGSANECDAVTRNMRAHYAIGIVDLPGVAAGDLVAFALPPTNGLGNIAWFAVTATDSAGNTSAFSPCMAGDTVFSYGMEF